MVARSPPARVRPRGTCLPCRDLHRLERQRGLGGVLERSTASASDTPARPLRGLGPAWSPDGRTIAFLRRLPTDTGPDDGVYLLDVNGGGVRRLTSTRAETRQLAWSPDGRTIAVGLVLVDVRTGASTPIGTAATASSVDAVAWSPDGRLLAFTNDRGVHVVDAAGAGHPRLVAAARFVRGVAWSPDGRRLVFAGRRSPVRERSEERIEPSTDLYVVRADGRELRRLTATPGPEFSPSWR